MNRRKILKSLAGAVLLWPVAFNARGQAKRLRVGISSPEAQNPFHRALSRSIELTLKERQIEPMLLSANADVNEPGHARCRILIDCASRTGTAIYGRRQE